ITDTAVPTATTVSQCNVSGGAQCCESTTTVSSGSADGFAALGAIGVAVSDIEELIGIGCTPITVGQSCSASPVCCENLHGGNLISIGCVPIVL
ncbi:hypothetical protein FOMPIDRAFT_1095680, partial [Fomitopsis schrenkii]